MRRLVALLLVLASGMAGRADAVQRIDRALFSAAGGPAEAVALPDTWSLRRIPLSTQGRYTVEFDLAALPGEPLAARLERVSTRRSVRLNGVLLQAEGVGPAGANPGHPVAALIDLPPSLLRSGRNRLDIEVEHQVRGGLSEVEIGSKLVLREEHDAHRLLTVSLPQAMNLLAAGAALVLLLVWLRRRSEVAVGAFGAFALLTAVRSYTYYLDSALGSAVVGDGLIFASQVAGVILFFLFAQAYAGRWWPRGTRLILLAGVLLCALGLWAIGAGHAAAARRLIYPLLLALGCTGLALMVRATPYRGGWRPLLPVVAIASLLAANVHDFVRQTFGIHPVTSHYLTPFVLPVALMAVSLSLFERLVAALDRVEGINRELEARVAQRTLELESANLAKTRFLASASHDLRQPLASIGLLIGIAQERAAAPALRSLLDRASAALASMESLLSGLLDLSRLDGGVVQVRMQSVPLQAIWSAIEPHEQPAALRKGLRLRFRPTSLAVHSDPLLLERVVRNLVANAVRYTPSGGVLVAARRRGLTVRVEVRDSGPGIGAADQPRVFQEFARLADAPDAQGLGLGLTIVRRTVDLLGHVLELRSAEGRGSCFAVLMEAAEPAHPAVPSPPPAAAGLPLQWCRAVVVEDDPDMREALVSRLLAWGAQVHSFADLSALRGWLDGRHPDVDLALCDMQLGAASGFDAIRVIRGGQPRCVAAVLVTGDTDPAHLAALRASPDPVLHKPFRSETLLELITKELHAVKDPMA